jgi:hypothetical protein
MKRTTAVSPELEVYLKSEGYVHIRYIPGRGVCAIMKFIFTYGLVYGIDSIGYKGRWCYGSLAEAFAALHMWDGKEDPPGKWIKYKGVGGERSNPNNHAE